MKIKKLCLALAAACAFGAGSAQAATELQWWHSMTGALGDRVNDIANKFNASQSDYKVVPVYKGGYTESMTAAVAAIRSAYLIFQDGRVLSTACGPTLGWSQC